MIDVIYWLAGGFGLFLIGANVAFLTQLGNKLTRWFTFKIMAVTAMLSYIVLSLFLGIPSPTRASLGLGAMMTDMVALVWMWRSIEGLAARGVVGFLPIGKLAPEEAEAVADVLESNGKH